MESVNKDRAKCRTLAAPDLANRWGYRLKVLLFRRDFGCCSSTGLIRRRSLTLCYISLDGTEGFATLETRA